ncbi:hypothetical protein DFH28DRAFT_10597 [Melampsora americana]|nr:hypothetical protein DFH28DRAFT_10597 [Melampsora americana]
MVGLCSLMLVVPSNQTHQDFDPYSYLFDSAALSQMGVFDSLRITLIYHEACKSIGESKSMASSLLRMATLLDDITAAVLYEQTAKSLPPRQSMLYFVLSSRCYELAGQRSLSTQTLRYCIGGGGWSGIANYVDEVLGRQASNETRWDLAVQHFWKLIKRRLINSGEGDGLNDQGYLDNLVTAFENLNQEERKTFVNSDRFTQGILDMKLTRVRIPEQQQEQQEGDDQFEENWISLQDRLPFDWKLKKEKKKQIAIVEVPFYLDLALKNPLNTIGEDDRYQDSNGYFVK